VIVVLMILKKHCTSPDNCSAVVLIFKLLWSRNHFVFENDVNKFVSSRSAKFCTINLFKAFGKVMLVIFFVVFSSSSFICQEHIQHNVH